MSDISARISVTNYPSFNAAVETLNHLLQLLEMKSGGNSYRKQDREYIEYSHPEKTVRRNPLHDRIFPMETVEITRYNTDHDSSIGTAILHIGSYADEYARSMNALAIAFGNDIYFRNNAYNPTTEEGRALIAHELAHVAQYEEKRITPATTKEALEHEAEQAEEKERYTSDPYVRVKAGRKVFTLRQSQIKPMAEMVAQKVTQWMKEQKSVLSEQEYLIFLCKCQKWMNGKN